jgi:hypothetical protein
MGETIAFRICNKPFKPLGIPKGQMKSCEGLTSMIPTNTLKHYVIDKQWLPHKYMVHTSWAGLTRWTLQSHHQDIKTHSTHSWKIETTHAPTSAKWD